MNELRARTSLWWRLARRFMRTRPLRRAATIVLATTAGLVLMYVVLSAFSLSGTQILDRDFGRFSARAELGDFSMPPGASQPGLAATAAVRRAGAQDVLALLESYDVRPVAPDPPLTVFRETDWASRPFPDRYSLLHGRWPAAPGEVAVTARMARYARGSVLRVISGNESLRVVGTTRDRFGTEAAAILAAPGTWKAFDGPKLADKYPSLQTTPQVLWSGASENRVVAELARVLPAGTDHTGPVTSTRATELATPRRSWVDRIPIAYRIPSIVLTLLSVLVVFGVSGRRLRRNIWTLRAVGVSAHDATIAVALAGSALCLAAAAAGVALGALLGLAARPLAELASTRPLSPYPNIVVPALRLWLTALLACAGAATALLLANRRSFTGPLRSMRSRAGAASNARHALATISAALAIWQIFTIQDFESTIVLVGTAAVTLALMTPELVGSILARLPSSGPRRRLARQQMLGDRGRVTIVVALLTVSLGPALAMVTVLETSSASDEANRLSLAAPGQVLLLNGARPLHGPPRALVARVRAGVAAGHPPVQVYELATERSRASLAGNVSSVFAVDRVEDAVKLTNAGMTSKQKTMLRDGGMLTWDGRGGHERTLTVVAQATPAARSTTTPALPATDDAFQVNWEQRFGAMMLAQTARQLDLPMTASELVLTGVSDEMARKAERIAQDAGYQSQFVETYAPPDRAQLPPALWAAALGLAVLLLLAMFAVARAQTTALRGYMAGLIAIGLPPRWVRDVLRLELAVIAAISTALGAVIGFGPLIAAGLTVPGTVLAIPWTHLAILTILFLGSAVLATGLASTHLKPSERTRAPV